MVVSFFDVRAQGKSTHMPSNRKKLMFVLVWWGSWLHISGIRRQLFPSYAGGKQCVGYKALL